MRLPHLHRWRKAKAWKLRDGQMWIRYCRKCGRQDLVIEKAEVS